MQPNHVSSIGTKYWISLIVVSIFGVNAGDLLADVVNLGVRGNLSPLVPDIGDIRQRLDTDSVHDGIGSLRQMKEGKIDGR